MKIRVYGQVQDCDVDDSPMNVVLHFNSNNELRGDEPPEDEGRYMGFAVGLTQEDVFGLALEMVRQYPEWSPGRDDLPQIGKPWETETRVGINMGNWFLSPDDAEALGIALIRSAQAARIDANAEQDES